MSGKFQKLFKGCDVGTIIYDQQYDCLGVAISLCIPTNLAKELANGLLKSETEYYKLLDPIEKVLELLPQEHAKSTCKTERVLWFEAIEIGE